MGEQKQLQFAIHSFEVERFSFAQPKSPVRKDRIDYRFNPRFKFDAESNQFHVGIQVEVKTGKQNPEELASIQTLTTFQLKGMNSESDKGLPKELVTTFLSIAYSNTRGALMAKAEGVVAASAPLPLINPAEIVESFIQKKQES